MSYGVYLGFMVPLVGCFGAFFGAMMPVYWWRSQRPLAAKLVRVVGVSYVSGAFFFRFDNHWTLAYAACAAAGLLFALLVPEDRALIVERGPHGLSIRTEPRE